MIAFNILPELVIFVLCTVISTVSAADIIPMLIAFSLMKSIYSWKSSSPARKNLQLPAALMLIELGTVISMYAGYSDTKRAVETAAVTILSVIFGYTVIRLYRRHPFRFPLIISYVVLTLISVIGYIIFRKLADPEETGTYNWIYITSSITLQYSEFLKLLSVAAISVTMSNIRKKPHAILFYYGYQIINVILLCGLLEFGTAMQFIICTCIIAVLLLPEPQHIRPLKHHLTKATLPAVTLIVFCFVLRISRKLLMSADPSAGDKQILGHSVHFWNIRLNSSAEEILLAKEGMKSAPLLSANLTRFESFKPMKPSVMTDYVFTLMVENFGWIIPTAMILWFAFTMVCIAVRHHREAASGQVVDAMAVSTVVMLLTQAAIHILGTWQILPFSGITLPFVSNGFNSLIVCTVLLTTTEIRTDVRKSPAEPETENVRVTAVPINQDTDETFPFIC